MSPRARQAKARRRAEARDHQTSDKHVESHVNVRSDRGSTPLTSTTQPQGIISNTPQVMRGVRVFTPPKILSAGTPYVPAAVFPQKKNARRSLAPRFLTLLENYPPLSHFSFAGLGGSRRPFAYLESLSRTPKCVLSSSHLKERNSHPLIAFRALVIFDFLSLHLHHKKHLHRKCFSLLSEGTLTLG